MKNVKKKPSIVADVQNEAVAKTAKPVKASCGVVIVPRDMVVVSREVSLIISRRSRSDRLFVAREGREGRAGRFCSPSFKFFS